MTISEPANTSTSKRLVRQQEAIAVGVLRDLGLSPEKIAGYHRRFPIVPVGCLWPAQR